MKRSQKRVAEIRKRAPGGGRKPRGPFAQNTAQLTIRMPDDMRAQLEAAAQKRGWSLTQELLWRARLSFTKERENRREPAIRALCFLISEAARYAFESQRKLHRDRFAFRAFRLTVLKLLDALEPIGEMRSFIEYVVPEQRELPQAHWLKTPEGVAELNANKILQRLLEPEPMIEANKEFFASLSPHQRTLFKGFHDERLHYAYGMLNANRDLEVGQIPRQISEMIPSGIGPGLRLERDEPVEPKA
jgi:hypothetical protein